MDLKISMLYSKIHRATVTDANLNYTGSISIDKNLMQAANLLEFQRVEILNINNGERFSTYTIKSDKKGEICLNGAAARKVCKGDLVIIVAYCEIKREDALNFTPKIVHVDENNEIKA